MISKIFGQNNREVQGNISEKILKEQKTILKTFEK